MTSSDTLEKNRAGDTVHPDWAALRREFPTTERFVYLDIARKVILPRTVEAAMTEWITDIYDRAGKNAFSMQCVEEARETVARLVGVPSHTLAFIKNTSEGVNILAQGLGLKSGDNVLLSDFEHENNTFPWRHLERRGIEVRWVRASADGRVPLEAYREQMNARTRAITAAWVAYGNGFRTDVPALADLCRDHGVCCIIDAIQGVGVLDIPLQDLGADAVISGGHKGMLGVTGAGFMYVRESLIPGIVPPYAAKFSFTSTDRTLKELILAPDAHRFEYGNPNFLGIWILRRSAEFLMEIGLGNIEARVKELTTYVIEKADAQGFEVRTPRPWNQRAGIVSFDVPGDGEKIVSDLAAKNIIVNFKDGHLRVAVHFYNNEEDIERLIDELPRK